MATKNAEQRAEERETFTRSDGTIKRRITAYILPDVAQGLRVLAASTDRDISDIVEEALIDYQRKVEKKKPGASKQ